MKREYRKSIFGVTPIVVSIAIYLFVIVTVLAFFYYFKYQITLVMRDQYSWNKFQEVPLNLLSVDIGDESFVSRMNKVYYFGDGDEKEQLKNEVDNIIKKQIFPVGVAPASAEIMIGDIEITHKTPSTLIVPGCEIVTGLCSAGVCDCICGNECPLAGKYLGSVLGGHKCKLLDVYQCLSGEIPKIYSAMFPFPLVFNGKDEFVDVISYNVIQTE